VLEKHTIPTKIAVNPGRVFARNVKGKNMAYESGFLHQRVTIRNKVVATAFGETTSWQDVATVWANVGFSKGVKALHEGALDAYDTIIVRMRYNALVSRDSLLVHDGTTYQIMSFHRDYQQNIIQITAVEVVQGAQTYVPPTPTLPETNENDNEN
jgi:SPP1 family predicted phage head-tail adaptor